MSSTQTQEITKRLHISGLTPALTANDIVQRLSTFGVVKAVDGFGLLDGVGRPRKFGYVTIETTPEKLARCLNLLSGSTWKGAKLRIGEAKPDFAERLARERETAYDEPPRKRRRANGVGVEAADMSLVTRENAPSRPGWRITPLGRVLQPVRMRPERPLPPPVDSTAKTPGKTNDVGVRGNKKKVKMPDERARRRTIDVTRWGSVHIKGAFLDFEAAPRTVEKDAGEAEEPSWDVEDEDDDGVSDILAVETDDGAQNRTKAVPTPRTVARSPHPMGGDDTSTGMPDVAREKRDALGLLGAMFGGSDADADWMGRESGGSDVDEDAVLRASEGGGVVGGSDDAFEVVPMEGDEARMDAEAVPLSPALEKSQPSATTLKELFAPQEGQGFSLLENLELDLELEDEAPYPVTAPSTGTTKDEAAPSHAAPVSVPSAHPSIRYDPKLPLFFPHPSPLSNRPVSKSRPRDVLDAAREKGWDWRGFFFRTETEDEIRRRWEEKKMELTREWKRRWREAGKISRRRRGGKDVDGE